MNRATVREMEQFRTLLFGQLARFHEMVVERTLHRGTAFRVEVAATTMALCWRDRAMFQPPEESVLRWLDDHLLEAVEHVDAGGVRLHADEKALLRYLQRDEYSQPDRLFVTDHSRYDRAVRAEHGTANPTFPRFWFGKTKECPPCWRCRYFDGWLPDGDVPVVEYGDPDITEACARIDARKVEIGQQARAGRL